MIKVFLIDDVIEHIEEHEDIIKKGFSDWKTLFTFIHFTNPLDAIFQIKNLKIIPDVIILDIQMPEMNGFTFADLSGYNKFNSEPPLIIIVSVYEDLINRSKANERRMQFLVKGNDFSSKIKSYLEDYLNNTFMRISDGKQLVRLNDICYIEADNDKSKILKIDGKFLNTGKNLNDIEKEQNIQSKGFLRVHESYIVNKKRVVSYSSKVGLRGGLKFDDESPKGISVPVGRTYRENEPLIQDYIRYLKGK